MSLYFLLSTNAIFAQILFLLLPLTVSSDHNGTTSSTFRQVTHFGHAVTLDCDALFVANQQEQVITAGNYTIVPVFKHWVLPNLMIIDGNYSPTQNHGFSTNQIRLIGSNSSLVIMSVHARHLGDYLCYVESIERFNNSTLGGTDDGRSLDKIRPSYSRISLYLHVAPIWEIYYMNFITALSAAGACLGISTAICIIYNLRWRGRRSEQVVLNHGFDPSITSGQDGDRFGLPVRDGYKSASGPAVVSYYADSPRSGELLSSSPTRKVNFSGNDVISPDAVPGVAVTDIARNAPSRGALRSSPVHVRDKASMIGNEAETPM